MLSDCREKSVNKEKTRKKCYKAEDEQILKIALPFNPLNQSLCRHEAENNAIKLVKLILPEFNFTIRMHILQQFLNSLCQHLFKIRIPFQNVYKTL